MVRSNLQYIFLVEIFNFKLNLKLKWCHVWDLNCKRLNRQNVIRLIRIDRFELLKCFIVITAPFHSSCHFAIELFFSPYKCPLYFYWFLVTNFNFFLLYFLLIHFFKATVFKPVHSVSKEKKLMEKWWGLFYNFMGVKRHNDMMNYIS